VIYQWNILVRKSLVGMYIVVSMQRRSFYPNDAEPDTGVARRRGKPSAAKKRKEQKNSTTFSR
jgi:hypothetical protein